MYQRVRRRRSILLSGEGYRDDYPTLAAGRPKMLHVRLTNLRHAQKPLVWRAGCAIIVNAPVYWHNS
jgi:hypothetical protein